MGSDFPGHQATKAFNVYDEQRETNRRVTYVIDKLGIIRHVVDDASDMVRHSEESLQVVKKLEMVE